MDKPTDEKARKEMTDHILGVIGQCEEMRDKIRADLKKTDDYEFNTEHAMGLLATLDSTLDDLYRLKGRI